MMKLPVYLALVISCVFSRPSADAFMLQTNRAQRQGGFSSLRHATERTTRTRMMASRPAEARDSSWWQHQVIPGDALPDEDRAVSFEQALKGAGMMLSASCTNAAGAMAKYVDPDDVGDVVSGELPPIWVPLVVVAVLGVGVGLLQRSLGDVMEDEAKLGSISGARAAKESARDRNMFKKK